MSSTYPILNNQPIDQLNVTELNDELKRAKLVTKGLKEDLINCLDQVLSIEREKDEVNDFDGRIKTVVTEVVDTVVTERSKTVETDEKGNTAKVHPIETENEEMIPEVVNNDSGKSDIAKAVDDNSSAMMDQVAEHMDLSYGADSANVIEDLTESKQFDSKFNVDELVEKGESVERSIVREERGTAVIGDSQSSEKGDADHSNNIPCVSFVKKQKLHDRISVWNNQPAKQQRMSNSDTVTGPDPQMSTVRPATAPKGEPIALKRNLSGSSSSAIDDAPKERVVPPSQRPPTNSLRIDNFLRPFTLKALHKLLDKTGNFTGFWMDEIKTHCYVSYSTVEEAIETRNAVYNLQWPPNGGRLLVAEYVEPQEVRMKLEPPPHVAIDNDSTVPPETPTSLPEPSPGQHWEQPPVPVTLPLPPPLSTLPPAAREWLPPPRPLSEPLQAASGRREWLPPPPQLLELPPAARERLPLLPSLPENVDRHVRTIDDIFHKTTATPQIYYLPLSEEQVAAKLAALHRSIEQ